MAGTYVYESPRFEDHIPDVPHPERAARIRACRESLAKSNVLEGTPPGDWQPATLELLRLCHSMEMIRRAEETCRAGGGFLDPDTAVSEESFDVALLAVGAAVHAVDAVMTGKAHRAFCLVRPPGHHATPTQSMGFCLFNNIAIAARHAMSRYAISRILIVDWDVHHGNGTQDCFIEDPSVAFFSAHRFPFYPGTGRESEIGTGAGRGFNFNLPVRFGTSRLEYRQSFSAMLQTAANKIKPELVLLSAGFDAHCNDPIGNLGLEVEDFEELGKLVLDVADANAQGRLISLLEGGYHLDALAECVTMHVKQIKEQGGSE